MDNLPPSDGNNHPQLSSQPDPIIEAHRETAQHQHRDEHGRFVHEGNGENPSPNHPPYTSQPTPNYSSPPPITITQNNKYSEKADPPMVAVQVTNPVTYLKKWITKLLKNQDIDIHLRIKPFATLWLIVAFATVSTTSFSIGRYFFPNSSPILHRSITLQGTVQKSETGGYYLILPDNTIWTLKPKTSNINLKNIVNKQALVKGNMTAQANLVEVSEVFALQSNIPIPTTPPNSYYPPSPATNSGQVSP